MRWPALLLGQGSQPRRDAHRPPAESLSLTEATTQTPRPLILVVLDGFGIGKRLQDDAIAAASMPNWRRLLADWPHARLDASGAAVGLPPGQMGNSEVGHLNLGAGK